MYMWLNKTVLSSSVVYSSIKCCPVLKTDSTNASSPGSIPGADIKMIHYSESGQI